MDEATRTQGESPAPVAPPLVQEEDVNAVFNLFLRREPEGPQVAEKQKGRRLDGYVFSVMESSEFHNNILPAVLGKAGWPRYRGRLSFDRLRAWVEIRSIFEPAITRSLASCESWREFYRTLLTEPSVLARTPKLKAAGVNEMIAAQTTSALDTLDEVIGDCDYANVWEVKGWCVNQQRADEKTTVEILVGGDVVGTAECREFRRDLQGKVSGDGTCGFTFTVPPSVREALREEQWVSVRERSTGAAIGRSVAVRNQGPLRVDQFDVLTDEIALARRTLERLERELSRASASLGHHLAAYDEYVRVIPERDEAALVARLTAEFGANAAPSVTVVLMAQDSDPSEVAVTLTSLAAQVYSSWDLVLAGGPGRKPLLLRALKAFAATGRSVRFHAGNPLVSAEDLNCALLDAATGEFLIIVRAGDRLRRDAILELAIAAKRSDATVIYADEDRWEISAHGDLACVEPRLKPGFDPDYLLSNDPIGRAAMLQRCAVRDLGGFRFGLAAGGLLDLYLRVFENYGGQSFAHCARVLFHLPTEKSEHDVEAGLRVVNDYLARTSSGAVATPHDDPEGGSRPGARRIHWPIPNKPPIVSIVVPTRDHPELIGPCLAALRAHASDYAGEIELFVVDNGTVEPMASALLTSLADAGAIRLARYPGPFNWSALNNRAVSEARGEALIFLNNDIVMTRTGWLGELVSQALRPDVGAVGARLLYPNRSIQHAGMVIGVVGATRHESLGQDVRDGGYLGRTQLQHRASAVTGACLATRREVFERLGGFDEATFKVAFNDTDYCMKAAEAGLAVVYTPFATMLHFESVSRGIDGPPPEAVETGDELGQFRKRWQEALREDRYYNPHFDRSARPFTHLIHSRP